MKKITITITLTLLLPFITLGQAFLINPIEGKQGIDYSIVNYVDWSFDSIHDHNCGSKTYDGHEGTDFVLQSFKQMDSGVYVLAAANGRVTFTVDTIFDREKTSIISKGLGNYICIKHPNKYYTYYAHLKKYSLLVQEGDSVFAGQRIAQVASSGNSTDPHLHFELWFDSSYVVDPFKGSCGNPNSLWLETPHYDSNFTVWEHGLHGDTLNIDILRERFIYHPTDSVYWNNKAEGYISLWSLMRGVRKGDSLTVKWFTEATGLVEQYTFYIERDYWYYYFWTHSALFKGEPLSAYQYVTLERNGTEVIRDSFASLIDNVSKINKGNRCKEILTSLKKSELNKVKLYDYKGADISYWLQQNNDLKYLPKGIYFIEIRDENQGVCFEKIGID